MKSMLANYLQEVIDRGWRAFGLWPISCNQCRHHMPLWRRGKKKKGRKFHYECDFCGNCYGEHDTRRGALHEAMRLSKRG